MDSGIISRLLTHAQSENFLGSINAETVTYKSAASANGQSLRGSWVSLSDCNVLAEFSFFGVISNAEVGPYGNQHAAPFTAWHEQGHAKVNVTKYQIHLSIPPLAPRSIKTLFTNQIRGLNKIKNASGLGLHCDEDTVEIRENEFGWVYLDDENGPYFRIVHPMFLESRNGPTKESVRDQGRDEGVSP
ncbi:uncharacterized protein EI90DRAFT_3119844 [Cantharellus anzutake]|uniref:uncharacterized protein n=1 Tax=Cantharellus anzutake TaxID=1750568 RepID=UPI00190903CA|nr:uncharacterized protein EI90DRAFT_3119844 [Cantharellus anzutake]KAF8336601.1 hypothetical protein EI90DRAFT_3119844 [Cantharellus anzutake]